MELPSPNGPQSLVPLVPETTMTTNADDGGGGGGKPVVDMSQTNSFYDA